MSGHTKIASQGFTVHGDLNGLDGYTAWHDSQDVPYMRKIGTILVGEEALWNQESVLDLLQSEVEKGGLVNMYWIGRNEQASIRADSEIVNWLEYDAEVWLTTWGAGLISHFQVLRIQS